MSQIDLNQARNTSHEKGHSFLFIHNQSNTGGEPDAETKTVPIGQAGDANAILLGNKHDVLVTSLPIDKKYLEYWSQILQLSIPQIFTPKKFTTDLVQSVTDCKEELVEFIKQKQKEGIVKKDLILSIFEADERDVELLETLQKAGLKEDLTSECNYNLLSLGNKDGFREFCRTNNIIQLPGGTFKTIEEVEKFLKEQHAQGHTVVIKSPHGIGGGGQLRLRPPQKGETLSDDWRAVITEWIKKEKAVEAEQFADSAESEHVVDIYLDPTGEHHTAVMFDQLVRNDDLSAGMAYFGAKYPSAKKEAMETIMKHVENSVAPSLQKAGYRGPAGVDVLWKPLHFMELNMRTDAITYVKHLTDRLGKNLYGITPGSTAFMALVNLPLSLSFAELLAKHADDLRKHDDGIFALSNPNRQRWGFYDVVAISPKGRDQAEVVMMRGLKAIWGEAKAAEFMKAIYQPHPQFIPATESR
jgi:hypothetical protein